MSIYFEVAYTTRVFVVPVIGEGGVGVVLQARPVLQHRPHRISHVIPHVLHGPYAVSYLA